MPFFPLAMSKTIRQMKTPNLVPRVFLFSNTDVGGRRKMRRSEHEVFLRLFRTTLIFFKSKVTEFTHPHFNYPAHRQYKTKNIFHWRVSRIKICKWLHHCYGNIVPSAKTSPHKFFINHKYNKILISDWLSALISALIGQHASCLSNWTVNAITRAL